jgi:Rrf2 family protein
MRLTAKSEYGLLALMHLARTCGAEPVSARGIAEAENIPIKFLEQLFAQLRRAGLVTAKRGAHGGFILGRPAEEITVLDVVEALEGPLSPSPCDGSTTCSRSSGCAAAGVWNEASTALRGVLGRATLARVAGEQARMDAAADRAVAGQQR